MLFNEFQISGESLNLLIKIILSLILGLIIGLEREHKAKSEIFAGIRTFSLITILGCISAFIYEYYWESAIFLTFGAVIIFALLNFYLEYKRDIGITTEIAVMLSYFIGVFVYYEYYYIAVFLTISITVLLALKSILESFAKQISQEDIFAVLKFFLITVVVYPLLPDKNFGPLESLNLKDIWKVVIIISALDFIGYILLKWKGSKILWVNGLIGGLVSSTAVTYELSKKAKIYPELTYSASLGITAAWTLMNFRVIFLAYIINKDIAIHLATPLILVSLIYLVFIFIKFKIGLNSKKSDKESLPITNPFEISSALQFAFIYALILVSVKTLDFYLGDKGIYIASFISGVVDVDAITLSLSKFAKVAENKEIYINGILIAVVSNSIFKFIYAYIFGNKKLAKDVFLLLIIITVISGVYILF